MASPTTEHRNEAPRQRATPGIQSDRGAALMPPGSTAGVGTVPLAGIGMLPGTEGGMTDIRPLGPLRPVLFDDIDPILLARLYPEARGGDDARSIALAAGEARAAMSDDVVASQNEPVFVEGDGTTPEERDERRRATAARTARPGQNNPPVVASGAHHVGTPPQQTPPGTDDKKTDKK